MFGTVYKLGTLTRSKVARPQRGMRGLVDSMVTTTVTLHAVTVLV